MTAKKFISDPVAGNVSTAPSGTARDGRLPGQDIPRVAVEVCRGGDEFRAVQNRTAAHRQQEPDPFPPHDLDRLHERLVSRVRLDAAKLGHRPAGQGRLDLGIHAVGLDAPAAVGQQHLRLRRDFAAQLRDLSPSEQDLHGVVVDEVLHRFPAYLSAPRRLRAPARRSPRVPQG
jgi:hypothetical protein